LIEPQADGLADTPLDTVSRHCASERPGNRDPDPRYAFAVRLFRPQIKGGEEPAGIAGSVIIHSTEVFGAQQTNTFRKTCDSELPFGADGQLFAALRPAARQNLAPVGGFHAGAETMRFGAPPSIRLKRSFRHFALSF